MKNTTIAEKAYEAFHVASRKDNPVHVRTDAISDMWNCITRNIDTTDPSCFSDEKIEEIIESFGIDPLDLKAVSLNIDIKKLESIVFGRITSLRELKWLIGRIAGVELTSPIKEEHVNIAMNLALPGKKDPMKAAWFWPEPPVAKGELIARTHPMGHALAVGQR
jgi:hypothetical protein